MEDIDKVCPQCGERYKWYEAECPDCHVRLVDLPEGERPEPEASLTQVFGSEEPGLVALAGVVLGQQKVDFFVRGAPGDSLQAGGSAFRGRGAYDPVEIWVRDEDAARAREILTDLSATPPVPPPADAPVPLGVPPATPSATVDLVDLETHQSVGRISDDDLAWLGERLEKESTDDTDYYFDRNTLDMLEAAGATASLLAVLRRALGRREGVELRWSRLP